MERMKNYGVYYWPSFSSTYQTQDPCEYGEDEDEEVQKLIFEIYMTEDPNVEHDKDHVWSSIDTTRNKGDELAYNQFPAEKQVLLLPQFCFMVIAKEQKEDQITIKVLQMPHQNMLKLRQIQQSQIVWIDP